MNTTEYLEEVPSDEYPQSLKPGTRYGSTPECEKCGAPLSVKDTLACRSCGWYASIGAFIEIDKCWEASADPEMQYEEATPQESTTLPTWAWVLLGCVGAVIVESVVGRLVTPAGSAARTSWSLTQLGLGLLSAIGCHAFAFSRLMSEKADTNFLDIILSPIKCWAVVVRDLPLRQWAVQCGASGLTAVVMSVLVIGGIPYHRLLDWGFKEPPKQNLMAAVMEQAQKIEGEEKSLEEAIEDFAGAANVDDLENDPNNKSQPPQRKETDCVILGYEPDEQEQVRALILGVEHNTKLVYACRVNPQISEAELQALTAKLSEWKTKKPYVKLELEATWVVPNQICRVSYLRQGEKGWLYNAEFKELRGVMNIATE